MPSSPEETHRCCGPIRASSLGTSGLAPIASPTLFTKIRLWCTVSRACGRYDRYLGYVRRPDYGLSAGSGQIWLDDVVCPDSSCITDLSQCSHSEWGVHDCEHVQDVSIVCANRSTGNLL